MRLTVSPTLVRQSLDGGLTPLTSQHDRALASRMFRLTAPRVVRPGKSATIRPYFRGFAGRTAVSAAAVIVATPLAVRRGGIAYQVRFLAALLVRRPNLRASIPTIVRLHVTRLGPRRVLLSVRTRNSSRAPAFVTDLRLRVTDARGRSLASVAAIGGFLLPHSVRDFKAQLFHRLPPGPLVVEANLRSGAGDIRRSFNLRLE